jgi:hypothetical protein
MRAAVIIVEPPRLDDRLGLTEGSELMQVQTFAAQATFLLYAATWGDYSPS